MKQFLEIIEQGELDKTSKFVKIEVSDLDEAKEKLKTEESKFAGLDYIKRFHQCYHDELVNKPCEVSDL